MKSFREFLAEAKIEKEVNKSNITSKQLNEGEDKIDRANWALQDHTHLWMENNGFDINNKDENIANAAYEAAQDKLSEKDIYDIFKMFMKDNGKKLLKKMKN